MIADQENSSVFSWGMKDWEKDPSDKVIIGSKGQVYTGFGKAEVIGDVGDLFTI
ncbi:MAG: hypothetical protein GY742_00695 [Hyphomicrobiales bacterium]|nr:hypothetical protein [Hyphomicrobiales bacterium]